MRFISSAFLVALVVACGLPKHATPAYQQFLTLEATAPERACALGLYDAMIDERVAAARTCSRRHHIDGPLVTLALIGDQPGLRAEAIARLEERCDPTAFDEPMLKTCDALAELRGESDEARQERAIQACEHGATSHCATVGAALVDTDRDRAWTLLRPSCTDETFAPSCARLAIAERDGTWKPTGAGVIETVRDPWLAQCNRRLPGDQSVCATAVHLFSDDPAFVAFEGQVCVERVTNSGDACVSAMTRPHNAANLETICEGLPDATGFAACVRLAHESRAAAGRACVSSKSPMACACAVNKSRLTDEAFHKYEASGGCQTYAVPPCVAAAPALARLAEYRSTCNHYRDDGRTITETTCPNQTDDERRLTADIDAAIEGSLEDLCSLVE